MSLPLPGRRLRAAAATVATAALVLVSVSAYADNIHRDTSVGASGPTTITLSGGTASTTIQYFVNKASDCDITTTPSVWQVNIAGASGVTASPAQISFPACEVNRPVTFTATSAGARDVTLSYVSGPTLGANPQNPAAFTLTVNNPVVTNAAPVATVGGVTSTAYNFGAVPVATCSATDDQPNPTTQLQLSPITGPLSGYGLGSRTATCTATDSAGLTGTASVTYTIVDNEKPVLTTPGGQSIEATGPDGAAASWDGPTATDNVALQGSATCDAASGDMFPLGTSTVHCSVTDVAGNTETRTFDITVTDTTAPQLAAGDDIIAEATGPNGAVVTYAARVAHDAVDGEIIATCLPASGSTFRLGGTEVTCSARDAAGHTARARFTVLVFDTTPPVVTVPADLTLEATSPGGATGTFTVSAEDLVDGALTPACSADGGDTFGFGDTVVTCTATDAHGNTGSASFTVTVEDTTPPELADHGNETAEATGPSGATVTYTKPGATDAASTTVTVDCIPESDTVFALGTTTVHCTATDEHGNTAGSTFDVEVADTTPPAVTVPADLTLEATGPAGAVGTFTSAAQDLVDGPTPVSCVPASGSTFALGTTSVACTSTDAHGNTGSGSFTVTVRDTTTPTLTLPANITTNATSSAGATVSYSASATDAVDPDVPVTCVLASGSTFAPGANTVNCSATDDAGNTATGSFTVTVSFGWTGFFNPVDNNGVVNSIKGGQSVPLKWNVPNGSGGYIGSLDVVKDIRQATIACAAGAVIDDVETPSTGGTSLRYDATANQFIYNWQSPKGAGLCYRITVTLKDDSVHSALFKTK